MVIVSQQPDFKKIQGEIAREVGLTLEGDNLLSRGDQLRSRLSSRLTVEESVLLILDDVWEALDLKKLGIPSGSNHNHRCKVISTTRLRDACEAMDGQKIMEVGNLSEEEAWILFRQIAGNSVDASSLNHTAKYLAIECKGLPLAIITIAGALKHKASLMRGHWISIPSFPASLQSLSNLRTLFLNELKLNDISFIGEIVNLKILNTRDSKLKEMPVEIGKLTNRIMWREYEVLERISPGVLSRLVRWEELYMMKVKHCSYSSLRELESLSRLTTLALISCSKDVIYSNLGLSSKLTRYALKVRERGDIYIKGSLMDNYNRIIILNITETTPLGDWVRCLLRK